MYAGYVPFSLERTAIRAAGCHFCLNDGTILTESNRFDAALTAEVRAIGMAMIKNIPLSCDFHNTSVVISADKHGFVCGLVGVNVDVVVCDDNAAVGKAFHR